MSSSSSRPTSSDSVDSEEFPHVPANSTDPAKIEAILNWPRRNILVAETGDFAFFWTIEFREMIL